MLTFVPTSGGTHQSGHSSTAEKPSAISHPNKKTKYRGKIVVIYMLHKNKNKIKKGGTFISSSVLFFFKWAGDPKRQEIFQYKVSYMVGFKHMGSIVYSGSNIITIQGKIEWELSQLTP